MINNVEIIVCKLELFKNPIIDFINQEISAESPCQYGTPSLNIGPGSVQVENISPQMGNKLNLMIKSSRNQMCQLQ